MSNEEREFIEQSMEHRERETREKEQAQKAKEKQRRRNIIALSAGLLIAIILSFVSFVMWQRANKKTIEAEKEKDNAQHQAEIAEMNLAEAVSHLSYSLLSFNDSSRDAEAVIKGIKAGKKANQKDVANEFKNIVNLVTYNLQALFNNSVIELRTLSGHSDHVFSVSFSPDGKTLASGSYDTVKLWNFDLYLLLKHGYERIEWYLKHNPDVGEEDRGLCDDVLAH